MSVVMSRIRGSRADRNNGQPRVLVVLSLLALGFGTPRLAAKETGVDGVMVYSDAGHPTYVQFRDLLINGKLEFRSCGSTTLDKNLYKNLPKMANGGLTSLERMPDGSLQAEFGSGPAVCVVPANFKFEKDSSMPMADLIDKMSFTAQVGASEPAGVTAFPVPARGAKIFIVSPTDQELARYLVATRTDTIAQWHVYLGTYSAGPHTDAAKRALEALLLADGQTELKTYISSKERPARYTHLKNAQLRVNELVSLQDPDADAGALHTAVTSEVKALCDTGQADLTAYRKALADHTPGYAQLLAAREPSEAALDVGPRYPAAVALHGDLIKELNQVDTDLKAAQANLAAGHFDEAFRSIERYRSFVDEEPRFKAVRDAAYRHHMDAAAQLEAASKFPEAVAEFEKADSIDSTQESKSALAAARASLLAAVNQAAADKALATSKDYFDANDFIKAYEILSDLTPDQRKLVTEQMKVIEPQYINASIDLAFKLQQAHPTIAGRADEDQQRKAYEYLDRVNKLIKQDNIELPQQTVDGVNVHLELLSDSITGYYVAQAKKSFDKPFGFGVGLGWAYLDEAAFYQPGLAAIRDERTKASATYQLRSKLSVLVMFRDQTSRRDSVGFAEQLQDSIATGLENAKLPVRVVRPSTASGGIEANYQLIGEILQHRPIQTVTPETLQSKYRFGQREIPNPEWNKADQDYQDALTALAKAQNDQRTAVAKNNKKMLADSDAEVEAAQKQVNATRAKANAVQKTLQEDVIRPYTYTKRNIAITNIVELSFRIVDAAGSTIEDALTVKKEVAKKFTVLENIKPDDTEGVHDIDAAPDEFQLMTDVEIAARDQLVTLAHDKVVDLPAKVLAQARAKVKSQDLDAAAELYILYLNSTLSTETPERLEAIHFLQDNYNIRLASNLSASLP